MFDYPPKPTSTNFQRDYGYLPGAVVLDWQWSVTFNRWSAKVRWPDGKVVWTWAEPERFLAPKSLH